MKTAFEEIMEEMRQEQEAQAMREQEYVFAGCEAIFAKNWEEADKWLHYNAAVADGILRICRQQIPPEKRREVALYHYACHGDHYPQIRNILRHSRKYRPENWNEEMPECVRGFKEFTVYRAGSESINETRNRLSWSLSRDVAEWFAERNLAHGGKKQHLYRAKIKVDDVLAYIGDRNEYEILQYRGIYDIEELERQGTSPEFMSINQMRNGHISMEFDEQKSQLLDEYFAKVLMNNEEFTS